MVGEELGEQGELLVVPHDRGEWRGWLDVPATPPEDRAPIGLPGPSGSGHQQAENFYPFLDHG